MKRNYNKGLILFISTILLLGAIFIFTSTNSLNFSSLINWNNRITESECNYDFDGSIYSIDAVCILEKRLPALSLNDIINEIRDQISDFSGYYEPFSQSFTYYGATPIFSSIQNQYLADNEHSIELIKDSMKKGEKIKFSYNELAQYYAEHLAYYVADKDLTNLKNCTRKNYLLALNGIDGVTLKPGEIFSANKKLSSLVGYCAGATDKDMLFYGGVCGMTSQLFRVSLLNPNITITKRYPHNERFVQYYGEDIGGDDAAVYERSKFFEIENTGESEIIFKVRQRDDKTIIVAIGLPTNQRVGISKENINGRQTAIHLEKAVYEPRNDSNVITRIEDFDSYYTKKNREYR